MRRKGNLFWAIPLIVVGLVWQLSNMGYITSQVFHIIVSWQALLMYIGIVNIFKRQYIGGIITFGVGLLFMLPKLDILDHDWLRVNWPIALIVVGIILIIKPYFRKDRSGFHSKGNCFKRYGENANQADSSYSCEDGYVKSTNYFGSVKQIVLDPVFKGASISNTFGGTVIDLRHTSLEAPETFIDIDCTFGGVEIYMPSNWLLENNSTVILGGCEDKRFVGREEINNEHTLIIRGNITFGGVEIKS